MKNFNILLKISYFRASESYHSTNFKNQLKQLLFYLFACKDPSIFWCWNVKFHCSTIYILLKWFYVTFITVFFIRVITTIVVTVTLKSDRNISPRTLENISFFICNKNKKKMIGIKRVDCQIVKQGAPRKTQGSPNVGISGFAYKKNFGVTWEIVIVLLRSPLEAPSKTPGSPLEAICTYSDQKVLPIIEHQNTQLFMKNLNILSKFSNFRALNQFQKTIVVLFIFMQRSK